MALIEMITAHHGIEPYFVVNDLLMAIEPLRKVSCRSTPTDGRAAVAPPA